jgi:N,N-dimethylformamidase
VRENVGTTMPAHGGDEQPNVRADLVYFTTPNDGGVFSTGSIAWCGSLSHNNYDNNVSRITENVLRRFSASGPLPK